MHLLVSLLDRRKRYLILWFGAFLVLLTARSSPLAAQESWDVTVTQVDNDAYPAVTVYVHVQDHNGGVVGGLPQDSFEITEDGAPVIISDFSAGVTGGVSTVLTVDISSSMEERGKMQGAKEAAIAYIVQIRPQDQAALVVFDERASTNQSFTADRELLKRKVNQLTTGACTALYDGLYLSVEQITGVAGRRIIILITDGIDCREIPEVRELGSRYTLEESLQRVYESEVPAHVIGLGQRNTDDVRKGVDEDVLRQIAEESGGKYYYAPSASELEALYRSLAVETQQDYVITYESPRPTYDGTRRDIQVIVGNDETGSSGASATYLEAHLLNIQSSALIGLILLLPLLALLAAPSMLGRTTSSALETSPEPEVIGKPPVVGLPLPLASTCQYCQYQLRQEAKFCGNCGRSQPAVDPLQSSPSHCPNCGNDVRAGARFCGRCRYRLG